MATDYSNTRTDNSNLWWKLLGAELHYLNLQKRLNRFSRNFFCILGIHHCQIQKNIICKLSQYFSTLKFTIPRDDPQSRKTHFLAILTWKTPLIRLIMIFHTRYCLDYRRRHISKHLTWFRAHYGPFWVKNGGQKGNFIEYLSKTAPKC